MRPGSQRGSSPSSWVKCSRGPARGCAADAIYSAEHHRPAARPQPALESQGCLRLPERHPERDQRQGRGQPPAQWRFQLSARAPTCRPTSAGSSSSSRPGFSSVRRKRPTQAVSPPRVGNGAKQHAHVMDARGSRRPAARYHAGDPPNVPGDRGTIRHPGKLRQRGQHRRLPQGGERDARPGDRVD